MPQFFFDLSEGETTRVDEVGVDLPDIEAARQALAMTLPRISAEKAMKADGMLSMTMSVRDVSGEVILVANLNWLIRDVP